MPQQLGPKNNTRMDHGLEGIARLRPGVTVEQAQADLRGIMQQIIREHPTENYGQYVNVSPYRVRDTHQVKPVLFTLLGAVGFVLLIACANITNLLLVKAAARTREIAVRGALGASRARLIRQFVVESVLLAVGGAAAGILLVWAAIPALVALVPNRLPSWIEFTPDARTLAFAIAVSERPAFQRMFADASRKQFDMILFWSLDRFSREGVLETLQHLQRLSSYGVEWFSYREEYLRSVGVFRDAVLSILACIAKHERIRLSERVVAGLSRAKAQGKALGRPRAAVRAERVLRLKERGLSTREIAAETGVSAMTVQRILVAHR